MAVTDALAVSPSVFGAGLAADDLILTLYFTTIYTLAKSIPPDVPPATAERVELGSSETHVAAAAGTIEVSSGPGTSGGGVGPSGGTAHQGGPASQADVMLPAASASSSATPSAQTGRPGGADGHGGGIEMKPIQVSPSGEPITVLGHATALCCIHRPLMHCALLQEPSSIPLAS